MSDSQTSVKRRSSMPTRSAWAKQDCLLSLSPPLPLSFSPSLSLSWRSESLRTIRTLRVALSLAFVLCFNYIDYIILYYTIL